MNFLNPGKKHILCAKNKKVDKRYQVNQEVEIEVSDVEDTKSLLKLLGFNIFRQREKIREAYHFENIKVAIDKYPNMAPYIEIEGKKKRDVINFVKKIGYKAQDMTNETATDLIRKAKMNPDYLFFPKINKE